MTSSSAISYGRLYNCVIAVLAAYSIYLSHISIIKEPYWLLPVSYFFLFTICKKNRLEIGKTPGLTTLNIIAFLRFVLSPIVVLSSGIYGGFVMDYSNITEGIYLIVYEMISIFIANEFFISKIKANNKNVKFRSFSFKKHNLTICVAIIILLILLYLDPTFVGGFGLITEGVIESELASGKRSSFLSVLWQALTTWTFVYLVFYQKYSYDKFKNKIHIYFSLVLSLGFILLTYIAQNRISRWYTVINTIAAIFLLLKLFPYDRKKVLMYISFPVLILITTATIYKNISEDASLSYDSAVSIVNSSDFLNTYISGPSSTNNSICLYKKGFVGIDYLPNDIISTTPIVNRYVDFKETTRYQYNDLIGRVFKGDDGDQIIPLIGQGLVFFGPIFCVVFSILMVYFVRLFDVVFVNNNSTLSYIAAFVACWFGAEMCLNMTINLSWIYIRVLPMWGLFHIVNKMKL